MCVCQRQHIIHLMAFFLHVRCDMFLTHAFSEWQAKCKTIPTYSIVAMEFLISYKRQSQGIGLIKEKKFM